MKKRKKRYTIWGRTVAFILLSFGLLFFLFGTCGTWFMIKTGFYIMVPEQTKEYLSGWYQLSENAGIENWILYHSEILEILVPVGGICGLLMMVGSFVYLLDAAGWKQGEEAVTAGIFGKVPTDVFTAATVFGYWFWIRCTGSEVIGLQDPVLTISRYGIWYLLILNFFVSMAARIKAGTLWSNTLISRMGKWSKKFIRVLAEVFVQIPLLWKSVSVIALISLAELAVLCGLIKDPDELRMLLLVWFAEKLFLVPVLCFVLLQLKKLLEAGQALADGDLQYKVSTGNMFGEIKEHAESLNRISEGVTKAVNERMKSERFKTELITNVSHDIKTPLTSIINYSDLLNKEETDNERIKEYGEVLYRQSTRLKKLIEDLVEASKASTGSIEVNLNPCEVGVLLEQTIAEFDRRLYEKDIDLICKQPDTPVKILADGRLLWRVFDNLMNNICKYAQQGTRVYLHVETDDEWVRITFKNISGYPLDISADELMERFVRGDRSRHTEGSGLGLSIAKSLAELQNGSLELSVDGDLFKVMITFPVLKEAQ